MRALEELLGRKLFVRNKVGARLTPAGEQFMRYAPTLVQVWERARQQVAVPPGLRAVVAVGGGAQPVGSVGARLAHLDTSNCSAPCSANPSRTPRGADESSQRRESRYSGYVRAAASARAQNRVADVHRHLRSGRLRPVRGAPEFIYLAYAVYSECADAKIPTPALAGLQHVARLAPPLRRSKPRAP
jgi:hypothetical protein